MYNQQFPHGQTTNSAAMPRHGFLVHNEFLEYHKNHTRITNQTHGQTHTMQTSNVYYTRVATK